MHKAGYVLMIIAGLIWVLGARSVRKENHKRLGKTSLALEIPNIFQLNKFDAHEKRKLVLFFLAAIIVAGIGPGLANFGFG